MDFKDIVPLRDVTGGVVGYFAKTAENNVDFSKAVATRFWPWLRNSRTPPMREANAKEMAELILSVTRSGVVRPTGERYAVVRKPKGQTEDEWPPKGAFEAKYALLREIYAASESQGDLDKVDKAPQALSSGVKREE